MTMNTYAPGVLHEPVQNVFKTQHSTPHNRTIAAQGLILLTEVGSTMHGVSQDSTQDDIDEMGVCIEGPEEVIGLGDFEQYEYRTQPVNVRSGANDIDRVIYSLRKFVKLAAQGNPTVLMPLFADEDKHIAYRDHFGDELRLNAELFITKQAGYKFLGYLNGQRDRYLDPKREDSKHASRPELIDKYGWDTKTGYHALRLAIQGTELMDHHTITLPMNRIVRENLLAVRNGSMTKEECTHALDAFWIPRLKRAIESSTLPEKPDYTAINEWLSAMYLRFWREKGWA